jgi:hypothetical protein
MKFKKKDGSTPAPGPRPEVDMSPISAIKREFDSMKMKLSPEETDEENVRLLWAYFLGGVAQGAAQIAHNAALTLSRAANEELKKLSGEPGATAPAPGIIV